MNLLNPDAFIARQNIERFTATGKLDVYYLSHLSDDAVPYTTKMLSISNDDLRKSFARELYRHAQNYDSPSFSKWQSLNISRMKAEKILRPKIRELEPYKDYQQPKSELQTLPPEGQYETNKEDRNSDGKTDFILYHLPNGADADFAFQDNDFDGYFDTKINYGYTLTKQEVRIKVK